MASNKRRMHGNFLLFFSTALLNFLSSRLCLYKGSYFFFITFHYFQFSDIIIFKFIFYVVSRYVLIYNNIFVEKVEISFYLRYKTVNNSKKKFNGAIDIFNIRKESLAQEKLIFS